MFIPGTDDLMAWGSDKKTFYDTNFAGGEQIEGDVSDVEEAAFAEEQEALDIQKRMLATLQEDDFDLERFKLPVMEAEEQHEETQSVSRDISQLSEEEKREVLFKESPELFELIEDFKLSVCTNNACLLISHLLCNCIAVKRAERQGVSIGHEI
jgi:U3 small nucleolar RNA-associated protein 3